MGSAYSREAASANSPSSTSSKTTAPSDTSKSTNTVEALSGREYETGFSMTHPSSMTFGHSTSDTQKAMLAKWIGSVVGSPASRSALPAVGLARPTNGTCGQRQGTPFAYFDHDTLFWKTYQTSLITDMSSLPTFPPAGICINGILYQRRSLVPPTFGNGGGVSLPTIVKSEAFGTGRSRYVGSKDYRGAKMAEALRGSEGDPIYLHPDFAEAMMGYPMGNCGLKPVAMDGFRKWLRGFSTFVTGGVNE